MINQPLSIKKDYYEKTNNIILFDACHYEHASKYRNAHNSS